MLSTFFRKTKIFLFIAFCTIANSIIAQESNPWVIGVGFNIVDNSGTRFKELLNIEDNWNLSRLLTVSVEKRFDYDYGLVGVFAVNRFNEGKKINSEGNSDNTEYHSLDILLKNYTTNYFLNPKTSWFTGFLLAGAGISIFNRGMNKTLNAGLGFNIRLKYKLRLSFQTLGKFSVDNNTPGNANHLQHSISIIKWL